MRKATKDNDLMNEAIVEHASAKELMAQIKGMDLADEMFDAKVTVLGEYIDHHVKEERTEIFVKACASKANLAGLMEQQQQRKEEMMARQEPHQARAQAELSEAL